MHSKQYVTLLSFQAIVCPIIPVVDSLDGSVVSRGGRSCIATNICGDRIRAIFEDLAQVKIAPSYRSRETMPSL